MTKKAWTLAAALALSLTACVSETRKEPEPADKPRPAGGGVGKFQAAPPDCPASATECVLTVRVRGNCNIQVLPKEEYVVAPHPGGVDMVWNIDGNAVFPPGGGIKFHGPPFRPLKKEYQEYELSSPKGVFIPSKIKPLSATQERLRNQSKPGYYYYTVEVVQGGKACPPHDPGVVDQ
jgi:hypothetical protein